MKQEIKDELLHLRNITCRLRVYLNNSISAYESLTLDEIMKEVKLLLKVHNKLDKLIDKGASK